MNYLYAYFFLMALNALSIIALSTYMIYFLIPKIYKENKQQYDMLKTYMWQIEPLPKADIYSRYLIPFYGVFMSGYLVYTFYFKYKDSLHPKYQFQFSEEDVNKLRIFKRKNK